MSKSFVLSANATVAFTTFGAILHSGAHARREFCVAFVAEVVEHGATVDEVANAAKLTADYEAMEDAERALFRKQVQYCRAIASGWKALGAANQRAFVGGALPASSAVKLLNAKSAPAATPTADAPTADAPTADETVKVSQPSGAEVISPAEMGVHFAAWLDQLDPAKATAAEAKAIAEVSASLDAFRAKVADAAKTPVRLAA